MGIVLNAYGNETLSQTSLIYISNQYDSISLIAPQMIIDCNENLRRKKKDYLRELALSWEGILIFLANLHSI